jgi:hypothetical protein
LHHENQVKKEENQNKLERVSGLSSPNVIVVE